MRKATTALCLTASIVLYGCGLHVPDMQPFYKSEIKERADENVIVGQINCELRKGVYDALVQYATGGNDISWLKDWGAKITLTLTVDEKGGLAPGVSLTTPFASDVKHFSTGTVTTPQSFALGIGVQGNADASRKETISYVYSFKDLKIDPANKDFPVPPAKCDHEDGFFINSNLKIAEFINSKIFLAWVPGSVAPVVKSAPGSAKPKSPFSAFSDDIAFVVSYGGAITPTWKFVAFTVSTNAAGPLVSASRITTQDVLITLAETKPSDNGEPAKFNPSADQQHNAQLTGLFSANSVLSQ